MIEASLSLLTQPSPKPIKSPAKRVLIGEEKQQSDMEFSAEPQGADGNGMSGVCFDEDVP